jgi:hypothetical protein
LLYRLGTLSVLTAFVWVFFLTAYTSTNSNPMLLFIFIFILMSYMMWFDWCIDQWYHLLWSEGLFLRIRFQWLHIVCLID